MADTPSDLGTEPDRSAVHPPGASAAEGAGARVAAQFNRQLRASMGRTLPRLTAARYGRHLEMDEDLQVRVYSEDKRGYLSSDEVSSGMQRQTLLAFRFALAEELTARFVKRRQFIFLDEPFAFFDGSRMRSALRLLPELSDNIVQIWVVASTPKTPAHRYSTGYSQR